MIVGRDAILVILLVGVFTILTGIGVFVLVYLGRDVSGINTLAQLSSMALGILGGILAKTHSEKTSTDTQTVKVEQPEGEPVPVAETEKAETEHS